ncbi:two-component system response regulator [Myroides odoratimimus]|uniref:LytR/AlgR family response regulator transcription factor n=1 Tax=Myroides odoratimimus TaxID=76832 RepID=UPI000724CAB2|nr:LytTR family DNA-binding domain-containing protein [Myroides odoratimimus]MDM1085669.1 response regulator transcription factor [Myroides odoratimimus]MDM1094661.1 response regulator transcription factor [Myroides odoratimimus]MDM1327879.1 response regulator transcription factor [Myroides odoratimimus]MDM1506849.1 response regulator transcription factor [Myroides odoratimimus]MDM1510037.1 response regulator transcription factor [Myroides odoratimimus]
MNPIRCYILDDEPLAVALLSDYVQKSPQLELVGSSTSALTALTELQQLDVDLCFIDIQMPELTGLQIMNLLGRKAYFIITSAYNQYALEGYEHNVIDYLLKPITYERFFKSIQKASPIIQQNNIVTTPPKIDQENHLFIKTDGKHIKVLFNDLKYIEGLKDYLVLHLVNERLITLCTLKEMEDKLPSHQFIRVHKSFIINKQHLDTIERNRLYIDKAIIPIGETYKKLVLGQLLKE